MKKLLGIFITIALFAGPVTAVAAVKAGDSCKKIGSTATANGKKFTCVKSGKKLVWNKGVAVVKPTPTPAPIPTSAQSKISSNSLADSWPFDKPADENLVLIADG